MNWDKGADQFLTALSSDKPTPGGGAAAAMAGAMGCALAIMSIGITLKRKNLTQQHQAPLLVAQQKLLGLHTELKKLMQQDAQAYETYIAACRLPVQDAKREQAIQDALWFAASVPVDIANVAVQAVQEVRTVEPFIAPIILSDAYCAKHLLQTSVRCSIENIHVNMRGLKDSGQVTELQKQIAQFERGAK